MQNKYIYILLIIGSVLLFFGGPDYYSSRQFRLAWELGHICLFFFYTYALLKVWKSFARRSFQVQLIVVLLLSLVLGSLIEWSQAAFDRTFSLKDIAMDVMGSLAAVAFLSPTRIVPSKNFLRITQIIICLLVLLLTYPLVIVLVDQVVARMQFPVLSNFETPFEINRWGGSALIAIDENTVREGKASLKVQLTPARYSGTSLNHFPANWHGHDYLHISIFNPSLEPLKITLRINDKEHFSNGQSYSDRFNRQFILSSGWNNIDIAIDDIRNAPKNRAMNLRAIGNMGIFTVNLKIPRLIYIDDVRLIGPEP